MIAVTGFDAVLFGVLAALALGSAIGLVLMRNPVHSAMLLVVTLFAVAVLFVLQQAHFLAIVQVIVYAGAIVVLFLFVIMLLGVDRREDLHETIPFQRQLAVGFAMLMLLLGGFLVSNDWKVGPVNADPATRLIDGSGTVEALGRDLFSRFLFPFEITSVLLIVAAIGAVVLAQRKREEQEAERR